MKSQADRKPDRARHGAPPAAGPRLAGRPGQAFDGALRPQMESRFGVDFGAVRIHADADAAVSASAKDARAYTVGQHLVFGAGEFTPQTGRGRELIAHELAHTVQQRGAAQAQPADVSHSTLEASADSAGRAAANGVAVTQPLPARGIGVSRSPILVAFWGEKDLADKLTEVTARLKQASYAERDSDLWWQSEVQTEIAKRMKEGRWAVPAKPAAPPQRVTPPTDPARERAEAVAEAEAVIASMDAASKDDDDEPKAAAAKPARTPSKFSPGSFTDKDIYADYKAATDRIDAELAPADDPRPFRIRVAEAKKKAPLTSLSDDFPRSVWDYGRSAGLFAPREEVMVLQELRAPKLAERAAAARRQKMEAERQRKLKHEKFISDMNVNIAGAFATAPGKGFLAVGSRLLATPQKAMVVGQGINAGRSAVHGDLSGVRDFAISSLPLAYFGWLKRTPRAPALRAPGSEPPLPGATPRSGIAEPVTPAQVRQAYNAEPFSVQKSHSHEWHQQQWENNGGTGKAPIAFRTGDVIRVNELRWLAVGQLSEINTPADLAPRAVVRPTGNVRTPDALAQTGAAADPLAQTGVGPDPLANTAPQRQTQYSRPAAPPAPPPARFKAQPAQPGRPQGYPRVEPEVVVEAHRINPHSIVPSYSSSFHASVWRRGGGGADVPVAFKVGDAIRVDIMRLPADVRAAIGYAMKL